MGLGTHNNPNPEEQDKVGYGLWSIYYGLPPACNNLLLTPSSALNYHVKLLSTSVKQAVFI
jgi:hypothetical protein